MGGKGWSVELGKDSFSLHQNAVNIVPQRADLPSLAVPNLLAAFNPPHTQNCSQSHRICRNRGSERGTHIKDTADSIFSPSHRSIDAKRRERAGQVDQSSTLSNEHKTHSKLFQRSRNAIIEQQAQSLAIDTRCSIHWLQQELIRLLSDLASTDFSTVDLSPSVSNFSCTSAAVSTTRGRIEQTGRRK